MLGTKSRQPIPNPWYHESTLIEGTQEEQKQMQTPMKVYPILMTPKRQAKKRKWGFLNIGDISISEQLDNNDLLGWYDIGKIAQKFEEWFLWFPRITPYYKTTLGCDLRVLELMVALKAGFYCSDLGVMRTLSEMGAKSTTLLMNNLNYTIQKGQKCTFLCSNLVDLKILASNPANRQCYLLVQHVIPNPSSPPQARIATSNHTFHLILAANQLGFRVIGLSLKYEQCGKLNFPSYFDGIRQARQIFDRVKLIGLVLTQLDLGGNFPCWLNPSQGSLQHHHNHRHNGDSEEERRAEVKKLVILINESIEAYFPPEVQVITDASQFVTVNSFSLISKITRVDTHDNPESIGSCYFEDKSLFTSNEEDFDLNSLKNLKLSILKQPKISSPLSLSNPDIYNTMVKNPFYYIIPQSNTLKNPITTIEFEDQPEPDDYLILTNYQLKTPSELKVVYTISNLPKLVDWVKKLN